MDKQSIIDEIKRTARENGGVPLGRGRFANETGIRISEWSGRFWARWGDALRDAGFEPNAPQGAHQTDELINCLVTLARQLGHFPVDAELRLKASQDKSFPSHTIWRSHFGRKNDFITHMLDYCSTRPSLADVAEMCAAAIPAKPTAGGRQNHASEKAEEFGFVYLIRSGKHYKIGRSNSAGRRQYELAIQLPDKAQKGHEIRTDDPVGIEAYWHSRFAAKRKNGEWFELAAADIAAFRRRKFM